MSFGVVYGTHNPALFACYSKATVFDIDEAYTLTEVADIWAAEEKSGNGISPTSLVCAKIFRLALLDAVGDPKVLHAALLNRYGVDIMGEDPAQANARQYLGQTSVALQFCATDIPGVLEGIPHSYSEVEVEALRAIHGVYLAVALAAQGERT